MIGKLTEQSSGTKTHYNAIHKRWIINKKDKAGSWGQLLVVIIVADFWWGNVCRSSASSYFVWFQFIPVVVSSCQQLLTEGDNISRVVQTPMLMAPELACCSSTCLHLIHMESTAMLKEADTDKHLSAHSLSKPILSACIQLHYNICWTRPLHFATLHLKWVNSSRAFQEDRGLYHKHLIRASFLCIKQPY